MTDPGYKAHETAVIDDGCEIGAGTRIWHFCHVMPGAVIGRDCVLGQNVFVGPGSKLGDRCKVQNNVSVYAGVECEEGVFLGPSMVFTNVINPRATIERKDEFKVTRVGRGATIGANATVVCGVTLGRYCMIGAGAVVTRDVPDFGMVYGVPGRLQGYVCRCGVTLPGGLMEGESGGATCPSCGAAYARGPEGRVAPTEASG